MNRFPAAIMVIMCLASSLYCQITWRPATSGTAAAFNGLAYGNGKFVACGGFGLMAASADGVNWTNGTWAESFNAKAIDFCNGLQFVAVSGPGAIQTSADGVTWTSRISGTTAFLYNVTSGNGIHLVVGEDGTILSSVNALLWTIRTSGTAHDLMAAVWGNGRFVVAGDSGTILTSPNGTTWTARTSGTRYFLSGAAYGLGQFVVTGSWGTIMTSTDGIIWTQRTSGCTDLLIDVDFDGSQFVAVGSSGRILTSADGSRWTSRTSGTTRQLRGVAWNGTNQYVAVGDNGTIITSYGNRLVSAFASDNAVKLAGVDGDDLVLLGFKPAFAYPPVVTALNIDLLFKVSSGHSWLSGFGTITSAIWNPAGDKLLVTLDNTVAAPTITPGDVITWDTSRVSLTGSFDPAAAVVKNKPVSRSYTTSSALYSLLGRRIPEGYATRSRLLHGVYVLHTTNGEQTLPLKRLVIGR